MTLDEKFKFIVTLIVSGFTVGGVAIAWVNKKMTGARKVKQWIADIEWIKDEFKMMKEQQKNDRLNTEKLESKFEKIDDKIENLVNNFWKFIGGKNK